MIESIKLSNFQSHKDTYLEFHDGVNVIVGESAAGKTALMRALKWVISNRPKGEAFRSHWGGDTIVGIRTDEGEVLRGKGKSNIYTVRESIQSSTRQLKAFGQSVPNEVSTLLNISSVNIQYQFDRHFLLSDSPGDVAQYLNSIVGLDAIDRGMTNISRKLRKTEQSLLGAKEILDKSEKQLEEFAYLVDAETRVAQLEQIQEEQREIFRSKTELISLIDEIEKASAIVESIPNLNRFSAEIERILLLAEEAEKLSASKSSLLRLLDSIDVENRELKLALVLTRAKSSVESLLDIEEKLSKMDASCERIEVLLEEIAAEKKVFGRTCHELSKLSDEYSKLKPDTCPLCGGRMK